MNTILKKLTETLEARKKDDPTKSYTASLYRDGITYSIYVVNTPIKFVSNLGSSARQYFNFNIILENKKLKDEVEQLNYVALDVVSEGS